MSKATPSYSSEDAVRAEARAPAATQLLAGYVRQLVERLPERLAEQPRGSVVVGVGAARRLGDDRVDHAELEKGRFVPIEPEDLDRLDVELTHSVDICDFVSLDEIDPIYFRQAYYLVPQEGGEKPYRLLVQALGETGRVGIAKVVIRNKQHLACLRPWQDVLVLETMYYAEEVRRPSEVLGDEAGADGVRKAEVEMAKSLVENLSAEFDPERYDDTYRSELLELIRAKAEGTPLPEPREEEAPVIDLMQALRESVERTQRARSSRKTA